jgi:hypothetical protein
MLLISLIAVVINAFDSTDFICRSMRNTSDNSFSGTIRLIQIPAIRRFEIPVLVSGRIRLCGCTGGIIKLLCSIVAVPVLIFALLSPVSSSIATETLRWRDRSMGTDGMDADVAWPTGSRMTIAAKLELSPDGVGRYFESVFESRCVLLVGGVVVASSDAVPKSNFWAVPSAVNVFDASRKRFFEFGLADPGAVGSVSGDV